MKVVFCLLLITSVFGGLVACAPVAQNDCGFVQNVYGERISWKGRLPIVMKVHESLPREYDAALLRAAETWNVAAGREIFRIDLRERVKGPVSPIKDRENLIYFYDNVGAAKWEKDKAAEQARTSVYWVGDLIQEADIRINGGPKDAGGFQFYTLDQQQSSNGNRVADASTSGASSDSSSTAAVSLASSTGDEAAGDTAQKVNFEALMIHELGHVLGLKHKDADNSVMATYLATQTERVDLAETDEKALQCEY